VADTSKQSDAYKAAQAATLKRNAAAFIKGGKAAVAAQDKAKKK
jgi:hypothetical protein